MRRIPGRAVWRHCALLSGLCLALLPRAASAAAIPTDAAGLPLWVTRRWNDFPVRIQLRNAAELDRLLAAVPIASFDREQVTPLPPGGGRPGLVWEPRITSAEAAALEAAGIAYERLPDVQRAQREAMEAAWAAQAAVGGAVLALGDKAVYHTQAQAQALLQQAQVDHPTIARYYSAGASTQGRPLNAIVITDNVGIEEAEPEVRLAANIHGDEVVQFENLLTLAEYLTNNYGVDPVVTELVDNTEIHIVPSLNPDGHVAGTRGNASGMDLNRNFPVPDGSVGDDGTYAEQIETQAIQAHGAAHQFVMSQVGHGGALVTNYLWDYTYTLAPDDAGLQVMALEYSQYNPPMYNSSTFPQGITNGAQWYVVEGSLQDWAYHATGCWDFTLEVSTIKTPSASTLDQFWLDNKQSLLRSIRAVRYGIHGVVTAQDSGQPLAATVTVTGNAKPVTTDPDFGDYYKILPTGTFGLTFSSPGYASRTLSGIATTWGSGTVLDVALTPLPRGTVAGLVRNPAHQGLSATVNVRDWPSGTAAATEQSDAGAGGAYQVELPYGEYTFDVASTGYAPQSRRVTLGAPALAEDFELLPVQETVLVSVDFEAGAGGFSGGTWALTVTQSHTPTHSLTDSPAGNYGTNVTNIVGLGPLDLQDATAATLSFWARWALETDYDAVFCELSKDGGVLWTAAATSYTQAASGMGVQSPAGTPVFEGSQTTWVQNTVDLATYVGQSDVRLRFRMRSDVSIAGDGFYLDDVVLTMSQLTLTAAPAMPRAAATRLSLAPNPFNPRTTVVFELAGTGRVDLAVYDVAGRRVATIASGPFAAGRHEVAWEGRDGSGRRLASGVYYVRLHADGRSLARRVTLLQ